LGGIAVVDSTYDVNWQTIKENSGLPVYNYDVYVGTTGLLSDVDAFVEATSTFDSMVTTTTYDTVADTVTTTVAYDSIYSWHWTGSFASPLFDGIEFSGDIDVRFTDSTHRVEYATTVVSDTDTVAVDTTMTEIVDLFTADSIVTDTTYTDNAVIAGTINRWALRGGVDYEIRWRIVGTTGDTITATVYDVTNGIDVPFGATWGDNWSFGPVNLAYPDVNSQFLYADNLSSRTYFYICGVKYYFNYVGTEAYPMNWNVHPTDGDVWYVYSTGDVVPGAGNTFTISGSGFSFGARLLDFIKVVPNPYIVRNPWEVSSDYGELRFTNLPDECTIRIYTISGSLIRTLEHKVEANAASAIQGGTEKWDVLTDNNQRPASGIYIYHIETPDGDTKTGKFALIR
jgi:hypothetical protein